MVVILVKTLVVMMIMEPFMILVQNGSLQTVSIYIVNHQGIGLPSMF